MTSIPDRRVSEGSAATYRAEQTSKDVTAQASDSVGSQWVLMRDVDSASGYQTPPPPQQAPEYAGQVVIVPAVLGQS